MIRISFHILIELPRHIALKDSADFTIVASMAIYSTAFL